MTQPKILDDQIDSFNEGSTGAFQLPVGTAAQRPASPNAGETRWNSDDTGHVEVYKGSDWFRNPESIHTVDNLDFGSLGANGGSETITSTVTGAEVGDFAFVTTSAAPAAGVIYQSWVSAADTVSTRATNVTGGSTDPAAQDFLIIVFKA